MPDEELPLSPYRVLDLTLEHGHLCGRLLADMGADVVKVEPPTGDPARRRGPFYQGVPHPERSFTFWFYNLNKRGITLNLESADGRELLRRLANTADVLIESFPPDYMGDQGLGYEELEGLNPRLVYTAITGFGRTGPHADYQAPDIVVQAMGGLMYGAGDPDRPPLRISFPQACLHGGAAAAVGTMLALRQRNASGQGQMVDVSAQQGVVWSLMNATVTWDLNQVNITREGSYRGFQGVHSRLNWPCKDGYVTMGIQGGAAGGTGMNALVKWMDEEGMAPDYLTLYDCGRALHVPG